ncbi:hypothetical protein LCGC14_3110800 [marine sediment metagenome]|uniref:Uncharacterized protein n=1 Tax=marine sediment metagenome TaxID=412755 RepID=A0A0F8W5P0_9ZZZZ
MKLYKVIVEHDGSRFTEYCAANHVCNVEPEDGIGEIVSVELLGDVTIVDDEY